MCVVADITSTLLSLSSMRKNDRETYGTCLNHNEESPFKSLVKHLLVRTVTIGCRRDPLFEVLSTSSLSIFFSARHVSEIN